MKLITLQEASDHVRRDTDFDDADLTMKIKAAESAVLNYMKGYPIWEPERDSNLDIVTDSDGTVIYAIDSNGDLIPRPEVRYAVLMLVAEFYKNRGGEQQGEIDQGAWGYGYLPRPVVAILYPLRDPAVV